MSDTDATEYPPQRGHDRLAEVISTSLTEAAVNWDLTPSRHIADSIRRALIEERLEDDDVNLLPMECGLCHGPCFATDEDTVEDDSGVHHRVCLERYHEGIRAQAMGEVVDTVTPLHLEVTSEEALAYDANDPKNPAYLEHLLDQADNSRAPQ